MDGRSISSRHDFSESENGSIYSGQGRTARTVSLARRYVSTVSLFSLRRKDSVRKRGNGVRSAASELFLREKNDVVAERRPKTSYLFSLGKERDGLAEIIPQTLVNDDEYETKHGGLIRVQPASPVYPNDVDNSTAARSLSYGHWRHSALLPLSRVQITERPGTCGSSVYSQDFRGPEDVNECASSMHRRESEESGGPGALLFGQQLLRTRSLLSLAKRYSSHDDDTFTYSDDECEPSESISVVQDASLRGDKWTICTRGGRAEPVEERPVTREGTISSTISPLSPSRDSGDLTSLPPLPVEQGQSTWPLPSPKDDISNAAPSGIWWRRSSIFSQNPVTDQTSRDSEPPLHSYGQVATIRRRPSSWSWLTINTARSSRTSSSGGRTSSEAIILAGQLYVRASVRASIESDSLSAARCSEHPMSSPSMDSRIYKGQHRLSAGNRPSVICSSEMPDFFQIDAWMTPKQDPLRLPPLQLRELPDEQRVSFYAQCGHFETAPELVVTGRELQGWCPECSKGRRSKREVVKKELKSLLKSIAE